MAKQEGGLMAECAAVADELLREQREIVVLHGDAHHGNVLDFGQRGWLAIDPKRVMGERCYDYVNVLCNPDLDTSANKVYGVVLTTADGSEYGLHHVTNIWRGTELGFNTDETYLASIIGKTVTQITYYTADGVYVLPVNVAL